MIIVVIVLGMRGGAFFLEKNCKKEDGSRGGCLTKHTNKPPTSYA